MQVIMAHQQWSKTFIDCQFRETRFIIIIPNTDRLVRYICETQHNAVWIHPVDTLWFELHFLLLVCRIWRVNGYNFDYSCVNKAATQFYFPGFLK